MKTRLLVLLLSCFSLMTLANEHPKYLVVWEKDGTKTTYALKKNPRVTFTESSLVVTKGTVEKSFPIDDVHHFTYESMMKGDVNEDAKVDIVDVTSTISHILSMTPAEFSPESADVNDDGKVNIVDVTTMIDLILKGPEKAQPITDNLNTGEAFFVYRNDDQFNAFFRDEVGSITYSNYDADGVYHDNIVSQTVTTPDSIYQIPLTAIESVGFVQPETVYKADVTPITGDLLDYVTAVDGLTLTLSPQIPASLLPSIGDKIVSVDLEDPFPYGFLGRVVSVSETSDGYVIECEFIGLEEAVERLCVTTAMSTTDDGTLVRSLAPRNVRVDRDYTFTIDEQKMSFDLSGVIRKKDVLSVSGKAAVTAAINPTIYVQATYVVNTDVGLYTKFHIVGDASASLDLDVAGEVTRELWKKKIYDNDRPLPYGFTFYPELGAKIEASGELAVGVTFSTRGRSTLDIVYCPFRPELNAVNFNHEHLSSGADWHYLAARASLKACGYLELGIGYGHHSLAKVGGEFELGAKGEYDSVLDLDLLERANKETAFYEAMNDRDKVDVNAYIGAYFVAALLDGADIERLKFSKGRDWNLTPEPIFQGRYLPLFDDINAQPITSTSAIASTKVSGDLLLPQTVGLRIVDNDGNTVETYRRNGLYWNRLLSDRELKHEFSNLEKGKKYKIYPLVSWFNYDILATPIADLDMDFPVELSDFKVTKKQYEKGAFTHNGQKYDYRFDVSVTATLDDDAENIADWGYVYQDPWGNPPAKISLKDYGTTYTDTRYAYYRNDAKSTCTLYGYVKYVGSVEPVYGEPHDYPLEYGETTCPDENHPHAIDLGLPSGTKWSCCNVGASVPEGYGNYYAWGETSPKSEYSWATYQYGYYKFGGDYSHLVNIGSDIAGSGYDAATANWGAPWRMPSLVQCQELINNCSSELTTQNGVYGRKFTSKKNGGAVFLPAAGVRRNGEHYNAGSNGIYWSSTLYESNPGIAYYLYFNFGYAYWYYYNRRYYGQSVRPVR